jgi:hypothetical protein
MKLIFDQPALAHGALLSFLGAAHCSLNSCPAVAALRADAEVHAAGPQVHGGKQRR